MKKFEVGYGLHRLRKSDDEWTIILITTGEILRDKKKLDKKDGWYWSVEDKSAEFNGPFDNAILAMTDCANTIQGHTNFDPDNDLSELPKTLSEAGMTVEPGIHSVQRKSGELVRVMIINSDDVIEEVLPDGWYWCAEYAKDKVNGPLPTAEDALMDAVRVIQEIGYGETVALDVTQIPLNRPTLH